ncbi:MAG: ABC transporter ATP-binding protein [Bacillota bacterium]|nr:ABC transporter ATP-binding protein [Bacillota bacterium]MDI7249064.1 ABC transporter ATP-binding protein [Bacillota bacterium]
MLLEVEGLTVCYDTAILLNDVSLNVDMGELVSLVGPNGAGKTTLLRTIAGLVRWEREMKRGTRAGNITIEGSIRFAGEPIDRLAAHEIARRGLVLCPERRRPFRELTVYENLMAGAFPVRDRRKVAESLDLVYQMFPVLKKRARQISGTLSGGEQQMLAIGRALMTRPKLLCIDEPSTGLAPLLARELFARIRDINRAGITVLLVEQDVGRAFSLSQRNYILSHSRLVAQGTKEELLADARIRESYLGALAAGKG